MGSIRKWRALPLIAVLFVVATGPASAAASPTPADSIAATAPAPRSLISGPELDLRLPLPDGTAPLIQLPPQYSSSNVAANVAGILSTLPHGDEMNRLTVSLVTAADLQRICGGASSCYVPNDQTMVLPVDPLPFSLAMPFAMTVAHEYGHHIERNRSAADWNASDLGGRAWGTYENVCEGTSSGRLFPGDEGAHYYDNPGEAFAQAYAFMQHPDWVPWWWNFARPDQGAYAAIRADVAGPAPQAPDVWGGRLAQRARFASTTLGIPLDGRVTVRMQAAHAIKAQLALLAPDGTVLAQARAVGARARKSPSSASLTYTDCGARSLRLAVRRRAGKGRFTVQIDRPR